MEKEEWRERVLEYGSVLLAAWRGDVPRASELMDKMVASADRRGEGWALTYVDYARSVLYNSLSDAQKKTADAMFRVRARTEAKKEVSKAS